MTKMLNVFKGPDAVRNFLDPGKHPYLPLVEVPQTLNPFAADRVRIFAKLMSHSPLANVKAVLVGLRIEHRGKLADLPLHLAKDDSFEGAFLIVTCYRISF